MTHLLQIWPSIHPGMFVAGLVHSPSVYFLIALSISEADAQEQAEAILGRAGVHPDTPYLEAVQAVRRMKKIESSESSTG